MTDTPLASHATHLRKRCVADRERQAAEFFKGWKDVLADAASKGFWRWQFRQSVPVTFHDTRAAAKVVQALGGLGFQVAWVPRHFDKGDPANPFGQPIWIKELRVWWHGGGETWDTLSAFDNPRWEGIEPSEHAQPVRLPRVLAKVQES